MAEKEVLQEMFNRAVGGVIRQGRASVIGSQCLYRGSDGLRCAVGWLIPDEKYDPEMDSTGETGVSCLIADHPDVFDEFGALTSIKVRLLEAVQQAHDRSVGATFIEEFMKRCRLVAHRFALDPALVE